MIHFGKVKPGSTIYVPFETFSGVGAPVTMTNFAVGNIKVYKDGSMTERASTSGFTLLDTDGVDIDSITGIHGFSIDLSDNTTADFWAAGSKYIVVVSTVTVDSQTMSFVAAIFQIGQVGAMLDTTIATLSSQTSFTLTAGPAEDDALNGRQVVIHDAASAVQWATGIVDDYTGSTKTVTLASAPTFTIAAKDNISVFHLAPLQPATAGRKVVVDAAGLADANMVKMGPTGSGTAQTARDIGASVLISSGTGTGQLSVTSGVIASNVTQFGGSNGTFASGRPEVNTTHVSGTSQTAKDLGAINVTNLNTLSGHDPGTTLGTSTLTQTQVTGGAYSVQSSSCVLGDARIANLDATISSRAAASLFTGITSVAQWLGLLAGKQAGNSTARTEIRATGAGSGTFDETTDSQEALRDRGDSAWITATSVTVSDKTGFSLSTAGIQSIIESCFTYDATADYAGANAGSLVAQIADNAGGSSLTAADIADAVWEETLADHSGTSGSTAESLNAASSAGDPWNTALPGAYASGKAGYILGTNLDAAISSRMATYTQPTGFLSATFPSGTVANTTNITAGTITTTTNLTNAPPDSSGVTTLLSRIPSGLFTGITSLAQWLGLIAGKQTGNSTARTEIRATGAGSGTYDETTDSQEALRDRGDAAWTTATGFSTHSAADVWAVATRVLTAGTNIGFPTAAQVRSEIDSNSTQLAAIVADTNELQTDWTNGGRLDLLVDAILDDTGSSGVVVASGSKAGYSLATTGLNLIVPADPSSKPTPGTSSIVEWIGYFGAWSLFEVNFDGSDIHLRNNANNANLATHPASDNGSVFTNGEAT